MFIPSRLLRNSLNLTGIRKIQLPWTDMGLGVLYDDDSLHETLLMSSQDHVSVRLDAIEEKLQNFGTQLQK